MNDKLITAFSCFMLEVLTSKKVISAPASQEMADGMVQMVKNEFNQYVQERGLNLDSEPAPEQPRKFTMTRKVIIMCRGSELSN
jgi:hypothetical protein